MPAGWLVYVTLHRPKRIRPRDPEDESDTVIGVEGNLHSDELTVTSPYPRARGGPTGRRLAITSHYYIRHQLKLIKTEGVRIRTFLRALKT